MNSSWNLSSQLSLQPLWWIICEIIPKLTNPLTNYLWNYSQTDQPLWLITLEIIPKLTNPYEADLGLCLALFLDAEIVLSDTTVGRALVTPGRPNL